MKVIPFDRMEIEIDQHLHVVRQRLQARVSERKWWMLPSTENEFSGNVTRSSFRISRTLHYKNSFLPIICGQLEEQNGKTLVRVVFRLATSVVIFMTLAFLFLAAIFIGALIELEPAGMIMASFVSLFISLLTICGFNYELRYSKTNLLQVLENKKR